jgi:TonB-dependent SusC/RagA subfamily outer membrane receptor
VIRVRIWWLLACCAASWVVPSGTLRAQLDTTRGAMGVVPLLIGDRSVSELGAAVTVLDIDSLLREFPVRTLTELLTGRVPGVEVLASSGEVGTASRVMIRGPASLTQSGAPQIYVDGIRVNDAVAPVTMPLGGQTTSRLDDLDVEAIATIAILPGPAAAALYGPGAANGVLLITTKRGVPGRPRLRAFTSQGLAAPSLAFPANFRAVDSSGARCTAAGVASGACRLLESNVLASPSFSPFHDGYVRQYGFSATGGSAAARYTLHSQWDGLGGVYGLPALEQTRLAATGGLHADVLNPNYLRRVALHGTGQLLAGARADLTVAAGYFAGDLRLPMNDQANYGLLASGLLGGDSAHSGWVALPGDIFQLTGVEHVDRVNADVAGTWRPLAPLDIRAVLGFERTSQDDRQAQRAGEGPNASPASSSFWEGRVRGRRLTGMLTAGAAFTPWPGIALRTTVGIHSLAYVVDQVDSAAMFFQNLYAYRTVFARDTTTTTGLLLVQEIAVRDRLFFTGALRRDVVKRIQRTTEPAALYPHLGLAWRGPAQSDASGINAWRLRAAYGVARGEAQSFVAGSLLVLVPIGPTVPGVPPERTRELEGGVDAELLRGRLAFSATVYDKRSTHIHWIAPLPAYPGVGELQDDSAASISNKGIELALSAAVLRGPTTTWSIGVSAWGNRNRWTVSGLAPPLPAFGCPGYDICQVASEGLPIGSYWGQPILGYRNVPSGPLAPGDVQLGATRAYLGTPFPTEGASLTSALAWRGRLRISALLEYRSGNSLLNATEAFRCLRRVCRAANDPSAPLVEQVAWAALQQGFTTAGWVESARFLKLREIAVAVTAPRSWSDRVGAEGVTLTLSGRNVASWTSYRGLDPEVNAFGPAGLQVADSFTQPLARVWSARLDLAF